MSRRSIVWLPWRRIPGALGLLALVLPLGLAAAPRLTSPGTVAAGQRVELRLEDGPAAGNPFDPDEIALTATVTAPSGQTRRVPLFWMQDFTRAIEGTGEKLTETGAPGWRLRLTATEAGKHRVTIGLSRRLGAEETIAETEFLTQGAVADAAKGWVALAGDHATLQTADGRPLRLLGWNVCWGHTHGTYNYDEWFAAMEKAGLNAARLWMAPWWANVEQEHGTLTRYGQPGVWQLDQVFAAAERHGIYLFLCLDYHGMFQTDNPAWGGTGNWWNRHPYNVANGGPCRTANDFFTDPAARHLYEKRLRYLVARYGASPRLLAWQFFNEIDNVFEPRGLRGADVIAWHGELARRLRRMDPYAHLITTSLTGGSDRPEMWAVPELDFAVFHSYDEPAPARRHAALTRDFLARYHKPALIGEFGVNSLSWARATDPKLRGLRQAWWGGVLGGSLGSPLPWWWQEMHDDNVYPLFAAAKSILARAGWESGAWRPAEVDTLGGGTTVLASEAGEVLFSGELNLNRQGRLVVPGTLHVTGPVSAERAFERLPAFVRSAGTAPASTWSVSADWGVDARLEAHVFGVRGAPELVARIDEREVSRVRLAPPKENLPYRQAMDCTVSLPVPPGPHTVSLHAEGGEWAAFDRCRVENIRRAPEDADGWRPEAVALRQDNRAIVYVVAPRAVYPAGAKADVLPEQTDVTLRLRDWPAGEFAVTWYDPATGAVAGRRSARAEDGQLRLEAPSFSVDLVAVVTSAAEP